MIAHPRSSLKCSRRTLLGLVPALTLPGCLGRSHDAAARAIGEWTRVTPAAAFPGSYGFPVHVAEDGRFVALHPQGTWESVDGSEWVRGSLEASGGDHSYFPLVQHGGEAWSVGRVIGDYTAFTIDPNVRRTRDYRSWTQIGTASGLPAVIFPAIASFNGALWILGGHDGTREVNAVWRSLDGLRWQTVLEHAPWSPRSRPQWAVFRDRLWLIGGGQIDGPIAADVWSSADGATWRRETAQFASPHPFGFSACTFEDRIWLFGANRSGDFTSEMLVSDNGKDWRAASAPWSPRGLPAVWTSNGRLYLTGGKYSEPDPATGEPRFRYSSPASVIPTMYGDSKGMRPPRTRPAVALKV